MGPLYADQLTWSLPHQATAPGIARRHVAGVCQAYDRDLYEVALLLTSELVSNAVEHGEGEIELVVSTRGERLHVEVRDGADGQPRRVQSGAMATRGRGLMLVERLATAWGVEQSTTASGKTVWFELRLPPAGGRTGRP